MARAAGPQQQRQPGPEQVIEIRNNHIKISKGYYK